MITAWFKRLLTSFVWYLLGLCEPPKPSVTVGRKYMLIKFAYNGGQWDLYLPYDPSSLDNSIYIVDDSRVIRHPPGVPFLVTPAAIDAKEIRRIDED